MNPEASAVPGNTSPRVVKIAPGKNGMYWRECREGNYICIGWDELGDLSSYRTKEEFLQGTKSQFEALYATASKRSAKANEVWNFRTLRPGDVVVANQGASIVLGVGDVVEPGYQWRPERPDMKHTVTVKWRPFIKKNIQPQKSWPLVTLAPVSEALYRYILGEGPAPSGPEPADEEVEEANVEEVESYNEPAFAVIRDGIHAAGLHLDEQTLRRYHLALKTRGFVILSGLSGTGKTWLSQLYAEVTGAEWRIVAVAPNWTTNEDLLGYYNPLSNTYQETEFGEFVRRAAREYDLAQNAERKPKPFHLVLDEMNLARVEYYFAKFLSALEIRARDGVAALDLGHGEKLVLTPNLLFIGTVNVDETTHGFADKVYDRAQLIELPAPREAIRQHIGEVPWREPLVEIWDVVHTVAPFAFRVVDEIRAYIAAAAVEDVSWETALDEQLLQKILPKFKGTDPRVGPALETFVARSAGTFPLAHEKATEMLARYGSTGFASFF